MKMNILKYLPSIACAILASFVSCNDLDLAPTNKFTDLNYWTSEAKASSVLSMAYSQMMSSGYFFADERLSDNLYEGRGSTDEKLITSGQANAALGRFSEDWKKCFEGIKTCHTFLENVDRVPDMDETLKNRMKAEARFIRAMLFFRLANNYGDVPLFDYTLTIEEANTIARSPKADVIKFVRDELNDIVGTLPTRQEYAAADNGRITKGAAMTLLARTYLYENDWQNVSSVCEKIINGEYGEYALFSSYAGLFLPENEYNSEVILDMGYLLNLRTWSEMYDGIPLSVGGRVNGFAPTQELVDDYIMKNGRSIHESGSGYKEEDPYINRDPRLQATIVYHGYQWTDGNGKTSTIYIKPGSSADAGAANLDEYIGPGQNSTATGYYLRKWFDPTAPAGLASGLNLILMRYADVLLMYAEAKTELGEMNETVWNKTIRPLRERSGVIGAMPATADPYLASYYDGVTDKWILECRRERSIELYMENTRRDDLMRWRMGHKLTVEFAGIHIPELGKPFDMNGDGKNDLCFYSKSHPKSGSNQTGVSYVEVTAEEGDNVTTYSVNKDNCLVYILDREWADYKYLYPVPKNALDINPNLRPQNPGWDD